VACAPAVAPSLGFSQLVYARCCLANCNFDVNGAFATCEGGVVAGGTSKTSES
jgi:uncharacterized protein YuzB (UPF0349 family)